MENRLIRVFISSTFRDLQDERDELMKKTFPVLRRKAEERDVTLTELDLRWGITSAESESGKVVEICFREIENSVPFFIGIIGNRYGWVPSPGDLGESLRERYSQVNRYVERRLSVTEMEMQFGVLERPEDMHAFFFIRSEGSDGADDPEKLAALKEAVRSNGRYPVSFFTGPEDLARQVEDAFTKLLDDLFPKGTLSDLERECIGQRAYMKGLCQAYIRTKSGFAALDEWLADPEKHQFVITGASGLGKSALVANWVKEKLGMGEGFPYRIICHFVGNGGSRGSRGHVIKVLCDEIRDKYGFDVGAKDVKSDEKALNGLFDKVAAEGDKPLLVVLDAVNQMDDSDHAKQLNWLPVPPKNCKVLFTTLNNDPTMEVFRRRLYPVYTLRPLTKVQRRAMVREYLGLFSKKLQSGQVERIVSDGQCRNTLVLKALLDELVNFGLFEKLDEKIDSYLAADSVVGFYDILLSGYEEDFGKTLVKHVLSLISVSRKGLSEGEILSVTKEIPLHWSRFYCAVRQHLIVRNGLVSFAHAYIRQAVENRYLDGQGEWERTCREQIVTLLEDVRKRRAAEEISYQLDILGDLSRLHDYLLDVEVFSTLQKWNEGMLGRYWRRLTESGTCSLREFFPLVERWKESDRFSLLIQLGSFTATTLVDPALSMEFIEAAVPYAKDDGERANVLNRVGFSYMVAGRYRQALEYQLESLEIYRRLFGERHSKVATLYNNVGSSYGSLGDPGKALEYKMKALDIYRAIFGELHYLVATAYNNVGHAYGSLGDHRNAFDYKWKALEIWRSLYGESHPSVANSYDNVGMTYGSLGDHRKALEYKMKSLGIRRGIFGDRHPDIALSYNNIGLTYGALGEYGKALEYHRKSLRIRLSIFGEDHPDVATSYNNAGGMYDYLGDHRKALKYEMKALEIRRAHFGELHPLVASSYNNVGCTHSSLADHRKALEYKEKALDIYRSIFGEKHLDVATAYNNIAATYKQLGDLQKALEYNEKALEVYCAVLGEQHADVAMSSNKVGCAYGALREHEKSLPFLHKALEIRLTLYGEQHADVAMSYNNIGCAYASLGKYEKALEYLLKSLEIRRSLFGDRHPSLVSSCTNIGRVYGKAGNREKEKEYLLKALKIKQTLPEE